MRGVEKEEAGGMDGMEQGNRGTGEQENKPLGMEGTLGQGQETMTGLMLQKSKAYLAD